MLPQQATSDRLPHLISVGRQRNHFKHLRPEGRKRSNHHGCNSSGSTIREKVREIGWKIITKVRLGGFCDWGRKEGRGNEETTTFRKFQEQMSTISPCSTVWFLSNSFWFPATLYKWRSWGEHQNSIIPFEMNVIRFSCEWKFLSSGNKGNTAGKKAFALISHQLA